MTPGFDLSGRVGLVTGAAHGIGLATARRLAEAGARVALNDIDMPALECAVAGLRADGFEAMAAPGDIALEEGVASAFDCCERAFGTPAILVNNAGIVTATPIEDTTLAEWDRVISVNLSGAFLASRQLLRGIAAGGIDHGRIIMMGSVVGHQGAVRGWAPYGATKGGLHALAKTLSRPAAAHRATVNVVAPGLVRTEMIEAAHGEQGLAALAADIPLGRLADPEDIAATAHFLASDAARYITGATIDVNGGFYIRA